MRGEAELIGALRIAEALQPVGSGVGLAVRMHCASQRVDAKSMQTTAAAPDAGTAGMANPCVAPETPAPTTSGPPAATPAGLTAEQLGAIQAARLSGRRVIRAATVAAVSGWTMLCFAVLTMLGGIVSLPALALGVALLVVARIELAGSKRLRQLDLGGPLHLALNQLALCVIMILYGSWSIYAAITGPGPYEEHLAAGGDMADALRPIANLHVAVSVIFYGIVITVTILGTGCAALYYGTRRSHLEAHLRRTPDWVLETLRAAA